MKSYAPASAPEGLPSGEAPVCWKADYTGTNAASAEVWVCGYRANAAAFDALQRVRPVANVVRFDKGKYLVSVRWVGANRTDITALMRTLEKSLAE